jgi:hypothetical protein
MVGSSWKRRGRVALFLMHSDLSRQDDCDCDTTKRMLRNMLQGHCKPSFPSLVESLPQREAYLCWGRPLCLQGPFVLCQGASPEDSWSGIVALIAMLRMSDGGPPLCALPSTNLHSTSMDSVAGVKERCVWLLTLAPVVAQAKSLARGGNVMKWDSYHQPKPSVRETHTRVECGWKLRLWAAFSARPSWPLPQRVGDHDYPFPSRPKI